MRLVAICAFLATGVAPAQPQDTATASSDDIVVIARKMRKARLEYATFGGHLKRCEVQRSSGEPRIDRIMCATLRACVASGARDVREATACIYRRIDAFEVEASALPPHPPEALQPASSQAPSAIAAPETGEDIVVRGQHRPDDGEWQFAMQGVLLSGRLNSAQRWRQCISPGGLEESIQQIVGRDVTRSPYSVCRLTSFRVGEGRVRGHRRCLMTDGGRTNTRITGSFNHEHLTLEYQTRFTPARRSFGADMDRVQMIQGRRTGACTG